MIYSATGSFLFVHISRCAGTLISNTLYQHFPDCKQLGIQHAPCAQALPILQTEFENLYKFSVVRNPWERLASWYELTNQTLAKTHNDKQTLWADFGHFLDHWLSETMNIQGKDRPVQSQLAMLTDAGGNVLVDKICRFEALPQELNEVGQRLNVQFQLEQKINASSTCHYSHYYNDENKTKVAIACQDDIDYFDYRFDDYRA